MSSSVSTQSYIESADLCRRWFVLHLSFPDELGRSKDHHHRLGETLIGIHEWEAGGNGHVGSGPA